MSAGPRVYDGTNWSPVSVVEDPKVRPVEPVLDGDGKIFVSIVSYRDGERCGETLKSLFENAVHPDNIVVGLYEQNAPEDKFCLEQYCNSFGIKTLKREQIRKDVIKVVALSDSQSACPHFDQVRLIAYHHIQAKGPMHARSLVRKVLGNEEFCMQIDAHTDFAVGWDDLALSEWKNTHNEFGILSNVPVATTDKTAYSTDGEKFTEVPRQCAIRFLDNGFPDYYKPADGKVADLEKPLLGHGWSAAFSFAKCHLEESAPYDNFSMFAMPIEQFSRFARFWTRGYDVYTPTRNIVFHDYGFQKNLHGNNEWFKRQRDRFRQASLARVKTILQLEGGEKDQNDQANLGIYGLGKRRSLEQLNAFTGMRLQDGAGTEGTNCAGHEWIPYDTKISPTENLFGNPDNLDPQPEYPLRTNLIYYTPPVASQSQSVGTSREAIRSEMIRGMDEQMQASDVATDVSYVPSSGVLFLLWVCGLLVWFTMFTPNSITGGDKKRHPRPTVVRRKSSDLYKDV